MKYPICEALKNNAARHCAALVITENFELDAKAMPQLAQPKETLRSGTLTFVKTSGRTFGITCKHLVEHYRQLNKENAKGTYSMRTMLNGFYVVMDRFDRPNQQFGDDDDLDIVVREVTPEFIDRLGKEAFDLDACANMPSEIGHAYAVGFPETLKRRVETEPYGYKVSMPQMEVLGELSTTPRKRFGLKSKFSGPPEHSDLSGMSGGPIFWSTKIEYGMLGITYEGGVIGSCILIYGEFAARDTILNWIKNL